MQTVEAAEGIFQVTWLLILFPLIGAVVLLLGGRRLDRVAPTLGTLASAASFVVAVVLFVAMAGRGDDERALSLHLWDWLAVGTYDVSVGLLLDQLSMAFVLLITGVGSVIHLYSIGYMAEDERKRRFFGYLNLFVAAMLLLVLADDFVILFIGWEGVGLASYLLIGFWQHKDSAATAAKKAFVVNRVGDAGMVLAIMSMFAVFGTTAFAGVFPAAAVASEGWLVAIGLLLLLGACGKSAQFPLQSWLLDAMEGPTPVSALIHAATMVTAGVYLVVRAADIYAGAPAAQTAVAIVGAITLLMGAIISCAKDDIKKALAGSTMSQIGYMMLAAGFGPAGYALAIFHLLTHGFFKANLFLGAGSVMHGMNDEVDMRRYGALRAFMPVTFVTFTAGYLALIGIPPFAGFFSKDPIIETAFGESIGYGAIALLGAGITAFYMTRVMLMTFFGTKRWAANAAEPHMSSAVADAPAGATAAEPHMSSAVADAPADAPDPHPHESPPVMTTPLWILGTLSLVGGFGLLYLGGGITHWLEPVTGEEHVELPVSVLTIQIITIAVVLAGAGLAWLVFGRAETPATQPAGSFVTVAARKDLYGDAVNETVLMRPGQYLTRSLVYAENKGLDAGVGSIAAAIGGLSARVRRVQTGFVRSYALSMLAGAAVVVIAMLVVRLS